MSDKPATLLADLPNLLRQCEAHLLRVLSSIPHNDVAHMLPQLGGMRGILFDLVRHVQTQVTPEVAAQTLDQPWPYNLAIFKLAASGALNDEEQAVLDGIKSAYAAGPASPDFARNLMLARLLLPVFDAPDVAWKDVPPRFLRPFLEYQFESTPSVAAGDSAKYAQHFERAMHNMVQMVESAATGQADRVAAVQIFFRDFCRSHFMVGDSNVLPIMRARYKILSLLAQAKGAPSVDWTPPERSTRQKIRLGVSVRSMMAGTETWAALASLGALDRDKYEIILFCFAFDANYRHDISFYRELLNKVDDIVLLQFDNHKNAVTQIRDYDLDILWHHAHVGLSDTSETALLFVHKLARVQLTNLVMHAATTGNPYFHYFLNIEPPAPPKRWQGEFSEEEITIPGIAIYVPDDWRARPNSLVTRGSLNIPADAVVYFSGAAAGKYNAEHVIAWLEIIKAVPNGYLVLYPFNPAWSPNNETILAFHARLKNAMEVTGIGLDRIRVLDHVNGEAIAVLHKWGDVHLSSFPYGGVTTISDALRGGLAVVTPHGTYSRANGDAHILAAYELQDLIAGSTADYIAKAVHLGRDAAHLAEVKQRVRDAWKTVHPRIKQKVALTHAALIDQIADRAFGSDKVLERNDKSAG